MKLKRILKWSFLVILVALVAWVFIAYWASTNDCDRYTPTPNNPMKAIVYCEYGPPEVLQLKEIEKPTPADNEVLVKVRAAGTNPLDGMHTGRARIVSGLRKPKLTRAGVDFAGTVEAVGKNVTAFKPGDEVFGAKTGAFAEYICVRDDRAIVLKPANVTFEEAGSAAVAALTALQGLRDKGKLQAGQKVLVNGAAGGVGTFAVQIAKSFGAEVTGVCSARNLEMVKSIGADTVIDYTKKDFTNLPQRYDLILECVGNKSFSACRRVLNPNGKLVLVGGPHDPSTIGLLALPIKALGSSLFSDRKVVMFIAKSSQDDLTLLGELIATGKLEPVIDRCYSFNEVPDAVRHVEEGHAQGKVIIDVAAAPSG